MGEKRRIHKTQEAGTKTPAAGRVHKIFNGGRFFQKVQTHGERCANLSGIREDKGAPSGNIPYKAPGRIYPGDNGRKRYRHRAFWRKRYHDDRLRTIKQKMLYDGIRTEVH